MGRFPITNETFQIIRFFTALFASVALVAPLAAEAALSRTSLLDTIATVSEVPLSETTSSFTPPNNSLLVVVVGVLNDQGLGANDVRTGLGVSGGGLTWTKRANAGQEFSSTYSWTLEVWTAPVTNGASMVVTYNHSGFVQGRVWTQAFAYTGYNTSSPVGTTFSSDAVAPTNGAGTMLLSSSPAATSVTLAGRMFIPTGSTDSGASPGVGWSEIYDNSAGGGFGNVETMDRLSDTSPSVAWTDINVADQIEASGIPGVAVEIKASRSALSKPPNKLGLIGYWSFDEGTGTIATDFSGNLNTLTTINDPSWTSGKYGGALSFDGTSEYLDTPDDGTPTGSGSLHFDDGEDFTASMWYHGTDTSGVLLGRNVSDVWADFAIFNGLVSYAHFNGSWQYIDSTTNVADDKWHHIVFVNHSNATADLYIDGVAEVTGASSAISNGSARFVISSIMLGWSNSYLSGKLDEVRIYRRALTSLNVQALYKSGAAKLAASTADLQKGSSLESGLVGHWTFDGKHFTDKVYDTSGQSNNGYFIGGATSSAKIIGKLGQALSFNDTTNYVKVPNSSSLNISTDITLAAWIKRGTTDSNFGSIISKSLGVSAPDYELNLGGPGQFSGASDKRLMFVGVDLIILSGATLINDTNWHHAVFTRTGSTWKIYLDGAVDGSGSYETSFGNLALNVTIGAPDFPSGVDFFKGNIDDVRIYNRALSADEVTKLYRLGQVKIID